MHTIKSLFCVQRCYVHIATMSLKIATEADEWLHIAKAERHRPGHHGLHLGWIHYNDLQWYHMSQDQTNRWNILHFNGFSLNQALLRHLDTALNLFKCSGTPDGEVQPWPGPSAAAWNVARVKWVQTVSLWTWRYLAGNKGCLLCAGLIHLHLMIAILEVKRQKSTFPAIASRQESSMAARTNPYGWPHSDGESQYRNASYRSFSSLARRWMSILWSPARLDPAAEDVARGAVWSAYFLLYW